MTDKELHRATMLLPGGRENPVLKWMIKELQYPLELSEPDHTATELAEKAAKANGHDEWLDDSDHWVWDAACIAMEEMGMGSRVEGGK